MPDKKPKKLGMEYKLGEIAATVKQLSHTVEFLTHRVEELAEKIERMEREQRLQENYILISKKKLLGLVGTVLGGLGSLIYYIYLILSGKSLF